MSFYEIYRKAFSTSLLKVLICQWSKLAIQDLAKIKNHKKITLQDAYEIGRIEVELSIIEDWLS